ncbi:MAG: purine-nucleoside phosphorylase [Bacillota bacterium]|nr:purine-nucleoside phosphorylase [Bacillota bacterium]
MSFHLEAKKGEIANKVLLPGDPLRAKYIAENFLENSIKYNNVRGMFGYTGTYKGHKVSVQGTGMGIPSISIYITELINDYDVKKLIRIGTSGSIQEDVEIMDIVVPMSASSNSNLNNKIFGFDSYAPTPSFKLFKNAITAADEMSLEFKSGSVLTSDNFYSFDKDFPNPWKDYNVLAIEMETSALFTIANQLKVDALSILTISDSILTGKTITSEQKERALNDMITLSLETIIK